MPNVVAAAQLEFQDANGQTQTIAYADIFKMVNLQVAIHDGAGATVGHFSLNRGDAAANPSLLVQAIQNLNLNSITADFQLLIDGRSVGPLTTFLQRFH
jgi:hypothetical protein